MGAQWVCFLGQVGIRCDFARSDQQSIIETKYDHAQIVQSYERTFDVSRFDFNFRGGIGICDVADRMKPSIGMRMRRQLRTATMDCGFMSPFRCIKRSHIAL